MSIFISMLIHCLLLTKMVFSENTFLTGFNSSSTAFCGLKGEVHTGQRDTKYPSCPQRVPGPAPSGSCYILMPHRSRWRRYTVLHSQPMVFQGEQSGRRIRTAPLQQASSDSPIFHITGDSEPPPEGLCCAA
jgi:hypothetical protein